MTTPKVVQAIDLHKTYPRQIAVGLRAHYYDCHIRQWCRGEMSSRELIDLVEGMPADSWLKLVAFMDADEAVGEATVQEQKNVRAKTLALLSGELKADAVVVEEVHVSGYRTRGL